LAKTARRGTGPRGDHSREEFQALVTKAAEGLVRKEGPRGLGMRRLAAVIGYAPNSIYNAVGDLDTVMMRVNARTLERLHAALTAAVSADASPYANAEALAHAYLTFVETDPQVWSLVFEHALAPDAAFPDWYAGALARTIAMVDTALAPLIPHADERRQAVATLWAGLHGLASLSTSRKLAVLTPEPPRDLARLLVRRFLGSPAGA
jgi:AcrR family transcriptional regulator